MENLRTLFCGVGVYDGKTTSVFNLEDLTDPSSCTNHALVISADILFLVMFILNVAYKRCAMSSRIPAHIEDTSSLKTCSTILNGGLGLAFASIGIWTIEESLRIANTIFPLHWWLVELFQGFAWLALSLAMTVWRGCFGKSFVKVLSILMLLYAGFMCGTSIYEAILERVITLKCVLDVLSLPGAILLVCQIKEQKYQCANQDASSHSTDLYLPLNRESNDKYKIESNTCVTPLSQAGFVSKMFFWWLNPLMKKGKEKILDDGDIPQLRQIDRAESCYSTFLEQLNRQKQINPAASPSLLRVIIFCQWKEILLSGFFALIKILTLSATPLLLNAFIEISDGKEAFKNEGFILALALFLAKCLECLSQRQWFFQSRVIGLQVRSLLSAAIYRKQQRLSNIAKMVHSAGEITNYVTVDAYRIGEFPYWFHQTWTTILQICIALAILVRAVGLATVASLMVVILTVIWNVPLAKLQLGFQSKLMVAQGERLKATTEALMSMKVLKLYAWETHFKNSIESLRKEEYKWLSAVQLQTAYNAFLFWASPVLISTTTLMTCYLLGVPLRANNVFTFLATIRMLQEPIRAIPDVVGVTIQARIALSRIEKFLQAPELQKGNVRQKSNTSTEVKHIILMEAVNLSWEENQSVPTLRKINLQIKPGEKVAICGEVGSGKSTLLTSILGEVPFIKGKLQSYGKIAYVSQTAWIQAGSIRENILFGSNLDKLRYQKTLERCSLVKDLDMLPYGDLTEIGERGVNLSGGQKQRVQLARALYQDADVYLLDDPFSAIDVHTATSLFSECIMEALAGKTVLLVTNQVDFLPAFDCILLMSNGEILHAANYHQLMESSQQFRALVNAHDETTGSSIILDMHPSCRSDPKEIKSTYSEKGFKKSSGEQLIKQEERETGASGLKPYMQYLNHNKGFLYFSLTSLSHLAFAVGLIIQNSWMAANIDNPDVSKLKLIGIYFVMGCISISFLLLRSLFVTAMGILSSKSLFTQLMNSLFRAPSSFYEATPLGRILSRVSSDLSIIDLDVPIKLMFTVGSTINTLANLSVVVVVTWQVLFIAIPMVYVVIRLQDYYFACAKEMMRINGTTKSKIANHMTESMAGAVTIRAFEEEDRFFAKNLELIDANASSLFHNFSANEWLIQRLELIGAAVLTTSVLVMALRPQGSFGPGFIGMALSYGLPLNVVLSYCIQAHCVLANHIVSVERIHQYTHIPSEAPEVIEENQPYTSWPSVGRINIYDLKVRYRPDTPLVLRGISCTFEGGNKIGIVGRTGSGKTTLISALFRIVEPSSGKVIVDEIDISTIGLHDLRSRLGIIPQDPTLFNGTVRYNLDPLSQHSDQEILEVLGKCQLREAIQAKEEGLDSLVAEDGSNWSMGQRQLFCLGRVLLRRCRIIVLDEATASIDNATDLILQKTIRTEFANCTVITVAHRIPTVMDCTRVLSISDGKLVEYDEPLKLIKREDSLFGQLVKEYWSQSHFTAPSELN
ncbi:hypothetical protein ACHQM5_011708 [Ranunculus cassubicifolius]